LFSFAVVAVMVFSTSPALGQGDWDWPEKAENLKVLPKDTPAQKLRATMIGFTQALGVRCSHCHVGEEGKPLSEYNFASDENHEKDVAREMMRMLGSIDKHLDEIRNETDSTAVNMRCYTCHRGRPKPRTLAEELNLAYQQDGLDSAMVAYAALKAEFYGSGAYSFGEESLAELGFQLLNKGDQDAAIAFLRLNVDEFPGSASAHATLARAYQMAGQKERAIEHCEKALAIDPEDRRSKAMLEKLRGQ
jgi:tetratricopeptide (TPR) repeat protein